VAALKVGTRRLALFHKQRQSQQVSPVLSTMHSGHSAEGLHTHVSTKNQDDVRRSIPSRTDTKDNTNQGHLTLWKTENSPHQDGMKSPPREGSSPGAAQVLTMAHMAHQDYTIFFTKTLIHQNYIKILCCFTYGLVYWNYYYGNILV